MTEKEPKCQGIPCSLLIFKEIIFTSLMLCFERLAFSKRMRSLRLGSGLKDGTQEAD